MDKYTASNGVEIRVHDTEIGQRLSVRDDDPAQVPGYEKPTRVEPYLDPRHADALREFFLQEAGIRVDEPTGALVILNHPPRDDRYVSVFVDGSMFGIFESAGQGSSPQAQAARRFFEAHPEPKPWDGAAVGEIWAVTTHGEEKPCRVISPLYATDVPIAFLPLNVVTPTWFKPSASITAARRIWPEPD